MSVTVKVNVMFIGGQMCMDFQLYTTESVEIQKLKMQKVCIIFSFFDLNVTKQS